MERGRDRYREKEWEGERGGEGLIMVRELSNQEGRERGREGRVYSCPAREQRNGGKRRKSRLNEYIGVMECIGHKLFDNVAINHSSLSV